MVHDGGQNYASKSVTAFDDKTRYYFIWDWFDKEHRFLGGYTKNALRPTLQEWVVKIRIPIDLRF